MTAALPGIPLEAWRRRGRTLDFKGFPIRYWEAGQGRPLLLIHGFPSAAWDWHYLWEPLAQRYRVLVCDLLGFGDSAKPRAHRYSLLEQADLQQALLGRLGIDEPLHVLAHDYGDSVAQELLARHHEGRLQLASCVFLNGGLFPETHRPVLSQKLLLSPLGGLFGRLFDRRALARNFAKVFGPRSQPGETELDAFWSLIESNQGQRVMHRLIRYIVDRREQREALGGGVAARRGAVAGDRRRRRPDLRGAHGRALPATGRRCRLRAARWHRPLSADRSAGGGARTLPGVSRPTG